VTAPRRRRRLLLVLALLLCPAGAAAQGLPRPWLEWWTLETEHFTVHYPTELREWTRDLAARFEAVHARVEPAVGYAPGERITVVAEDPFNQANGSAWPFLDRPAIYVWPTPPDPRSAIGHSRDFAELLAVHEFAHVAHLTRPSRNPRQRLLWRFAPVKLGPIARRAPRWLVEGYATLIEGELTGSGRPFGVYRPTVLREWALEGKLPSYAELDGSRAFLGGSLAYLAGSAYLQWLVEQRGDSSLVHLWRRMTARQDRSFGEAFAGVFGDSPADLYDRFTVDVTTRAVAAGQALARAGLVVGDTVQLLPWYTGDPAVSPDGELLAIALRFRDEPPKLVIWSTTEEPDTAAERARRRLLERDPDDVPAIRSRPPPKRALATLEAVNGRGYDSPRFLPDGERVLVTRVVPVGDGAERSDLFVWNRQTGEVRRVTHGAALRDPDPSPDGSTAVATRCLYGRCDLVLVDFESGTVTTLVEGGIGRAFYRPRWSPDGRRIVAAVQEDGAWRLVLVDPRSGALHSVGPADGASRYDAAWLSDGRIVATSERGGVPNLELLAPPDAGSTTAVPLTRVTGAAVAPAPNPTDGSVFFLSLTPDGLDLHRVHPDSVALGSVVSLSPRWWPAAPIRAAAAADTLPRETLDADRAYGLGPRGLSVLPGFATSAEGTSGTAVLATADPIGRLTGLLRGEYGTDGTWRGAAASAAYRGFRPTFGADLFWLGQRPSEQRGDLAIAPLLDAEYRGADVYAEYERAYPRGSQRARAGGSLAQLDLDLGESGGRRLGYARYDGDIAFRRGERSLIANLGLLGSLGATAGEGWRRGVATAGVGIGWGGFGVRGDAVYGAVGADAPAWERLAVGGVRPTLLDPHLLSQRVPMAGIPTGTVAGDEIRIGRVTLEGSGWRPYFWAARGDGDDWYRVVGLDRAFDVPALGFAGLPGIRLSAGVAYPLDEPFRHDFGVHLGIGYRP
jgi:hypothetical protein